MTPMSGHGEGSQFVKLTTVGNLNVARILAARLDSEGIEVRIHGAPLGPYPVTVGSMAETQIWVRDDRLAEASEVLLDAEMNDVLEPVERRAPPLRGAPFEFRIIALVVGVVLAALYVLRVVAVY
jgi:hypothetical protein